MREQKIGELLDAVKGFMTHERSLLEEVTALRTRAQGGRAVDSAHQRVASEQALSEGVSKLLLVAENYPQLKSSELFVGLQQRISALEEQIAHRREFYNAAVNINNVRIEEFPDLLLATAAGLVRKPLFEAPAVEREDVNVGSALRA